MPCGPFPLSIYTHTSFCPRGKQIPSNSWPQSTLIKTQCLTARTHTRLTASEGLRNLKLLSHELMASYRCARHSSGDLACMSTLVWAVPMEGLAFAVVQLKASRFGREGGGFGSFGKQQCTEVWKKKKKNYTTQCTPFTLSTLALWKWQVRRQGTRRVKRKLETRNTKQQWMGRKLIMH